MPRAGLSPAVVVDHALAVLDTTGIDQLTLKAVAERATVATPSLYKHVNGLPELRRLMTVRILDETTARMGAVIMGRAGEDALYAFLTEYRALAAQYPHRQALVERIPFDDPAVQAAAARLVEVAYAVVRGFGLDGEDVVHAVRTLRAAVSGFVFLEQEQGYQQPTSRDASFAFLSSVLARGLRSAGTAVAAPAAGPVDVSPTGASPPATSPSATSPTADAPITAAPVTAAD